MKRKTYIILTCLLFSHFCYSQDKLDSLFNLLKSAKGDTTRVMLLFGIADQYENSNQDSSLYFLDQAKSLSQELNFKNGLYTYYQNALIVYYTKGNYAKALQLSDSALLVAGELNDSTKIASILGNMGNISQYTGEFDKQLNYLMDAFSIMERLGMKEKIAQMYHNIANAYYNLEQFRKCIDYCRQALAYYEKNRGAISINRLYSTFGQAYYSLHINDSSIFYFKKAITESAKRGDKYAEGAIYGYMVNAYADMGNFAEMLNVSEKSLAISRELQSDQLLASSLYNSAFAKFLNDNIAGAKKDINEGLEIAEKNSFQDELKNIYIVLSYIAAKEGDKKTFLSAMYKADSVKTAQLNETIVQSTTELEKKYESEKKDKQIILQQVQLQKRRTLNYVLIGSAAVFLILSLLAYRNYNQKKRLQQQRISELEKEKHLTATEAVLKGEEQERTRLAKDLHDGLGGMLSGIKYSLNTMKGNLVMTPDNAQAFERSIDMLDSSIKEMRRVAHNMMPEALVKFGLDTALKDFCNDINQSGALKLSYQSIGLENSPIDQIKAITIYRIVLELINNTMKHAAAKNAIVQVSQSDGQLSVTVEDDGRGFDTSILGKVKGIGWSNIQNRVEFLKGKLDVNSQPGKGTSVHIEIHA